MLLLLSALLANVAVGTSGLNMLPDGVNCASISNRQACCTVARPSDGSRCIASVEGKAFPGVCKSETWLSKQGQGVRNKAADCDTYTVPDLVMEGCHTLGRDECCTKFDGRIAYFGEPCMRANLGMTYNGADGTVCQPECWAKGNCGGASENQVAVYENGCEDACFGQCDNGTCALVGTDGYTCTCDSGYTAVDGGARCEIDADCTYTQWQNSGDCSCETSLQNQTRDVAQAATGGGSCDGELAQDVACTPVGCPSGLNVLPSGVMCNTITNRQACCTSERADGSRCKASKVGKSWNGGVCRAEVWIRKQGQGVKNLAADCSTYTVPNLVGAGCHTLGREECCSMSDGRGEAAYFGQPCLPAKPGLTYNTGGSDSIVCQPECWAKGTCGGASEDQVAVYGNGCDGDCMLSDWVDGQCSCDSSTMVQTRTIVWEATGSGTCDNALTQEVACTPVGCAPSNCSNRILRDEAFGLGYLHWGLDCSSHGNVEHGGYCSPNLRGRSLTEHTETSIRFRCEDGTWVFDSLFSEVDACTDQCENGTCALVGVADYTCTCGVGYTAVDGGARCEIDADCTYTAWADSGDCSCDTSLQRQIRDIDVAATGSGTCDGPRTQDVACTPVDCPTDPPATTHERTVLPRGVFCNTIKNRDVCCNSQRYDGSNCVPAMPGQMFKWKKNRLCLAEKVVAKIGQNNKRYTCPAPGPSTTHAAGCPDLTRAECCGKTDGRNNPAFYGEKCIPAKNALFYSNAEACMPECWTKGTCGGNTADEGNVYGNGCNGDCMYNDWVDGTCSCDTNTMEQTRTIQWEATGSGTCANELTRTVSCTPVDCACNGQCDNGSCSPVGANGFQCTCDSGFTATENGMACEEDVDCTYSAWEDSGSCLCETSTKTQTRSMDQAATGSGTCDEPTSQEVACVPVDCVDPCEDQCANGTCFVEGESFRCECNVGFTLISGQFCEADVNCTYTAWSNVGECSCVDKLQAQTRTMDQAATGSGTCDEPTTQDVACVPTGCIDACTGKCDNGSCSLVGDSDYECTCNVGYTAVNGGSYCEEDANCTYTAWVDVGGCSCETETQQQTRSVDLAATGGGTCAEATSQEVACEPIACPDACTAKCAWGECALVGEADFTCTCNVGYTAVNGGRACEEDVNCTYTPWVDQGDCSCQTNKQQQVRSMDQAATGSGTCSEATSQEVDCTPVGCIEDANCTYTSWADNGECSCDTSLQNQTRDVDQAATGNGTCDGELSQDVACTPTGCNPCEGKTKRECGKHPECDRKCNWLNAPVGPVDPNANPCEGKKKKQCKKIAACDKKCNWLNAPTEEPVDPSQNPCIGKTSKECKKHPNCNRKCEWDGAAAGPAPVTPTPAPDLCAGQCSNGSCVTNPNSFTCICDGGYTMTANGSACEEDVNCTYTPWVNSGSCLCETSKQLQTRSMDTAATGSGTCAEATSQEVDCVPENCVDPCENQCANGTCHVEGDSFRCECNANFTLVSTQLCEADVNCTYTAFANVGECSCVTSKQQQTRTVDQVATGSGTCAEATTQEVDCTPTGCDPPAPTPPPPAPEVVEEGDEDLEEQDLTFTIPTCKHYQARIKVKGDRLLISVLTLDGTTTGDQACSCKQKCGEQGYDFWAFEGKKNKQKCQCNRLSGRFKSPQAHTPVEARFYFSGGTVSAAESKIEAAGISATNAD